MTETNTPLPSKQRLVAHLVLVCLASMISLVGCDGPGRGDSQAEPAGGRGGDTPAAASATTVEPIEWIEHQESVAELPGASVIGFESTVLVAKQAGYVKTIGRQGDREIDIGVAVDAGSVLAELHIPELKEELLEKQAEGRRALAEVVQSRAAVEIAKAMQTQVKQTLIEKQALRALRAVGLQRIAALVKMGAADLDRKDEARFRLTAAEAAVKATEAEVVTAGANIRKAEADVAQAIAVADVAAASVKRLEALNTYRLITAPFAGVVVARYVDPGAFVRPAGSGAEGSPLFEVSRFDRVRIVAFVSPSQLGAVRTGLKARFHSIGGLGEGVAINGTVDRSAMALDPSSRKMRIEMHVDNTKLEGREPLAIGQFGTLSVLSRVWTKEDMLATVPTAAVGTDKQGEQFVVVVEGPGNSRRVAVETVVVDDKRVGVIGEIGPGDRVQVGDVSPY
jgi:RND family efflux transporter MFP subunit